MKLLTTLFLLVSFFVISPVFAKTNTSIGETEITVTSSKTLGDTRALDVLLRQKDKVIACQKTHLFKQDEVRLTLWLRASGNVAKIALEPSKEPWTNDAFVACMKAQMGSWTYGKIEGMLNMASYQFKKVKPAPVAAAKN